MKIKFRFLFFFITIISRFLLAQNPGDTLFNSSHIHDINITFSQPSFWDSLMLYKEHADSFNISTKNMMGNFIIDGTPIDSVGIKLKGNSSFGYPGRKKSIKITFNNYVIGKKLEGLTVIDLNNNTLDPTMMREKLLLDFMNRKGLPAPRCTYARVSYNGQYVGLYKIIEQVDKEFIQTHYNTWGGNLFKGDPGGTLTWMGSVPSTYYPYYELHSNTTINDWSDLVNLIDKINNTPTAEFYDSLENYLDTDPLIEQWAARNLFVDLDAYFNAAHNYYLYDDTLTGKFEWCTWDVSVAFGFYPFWSEDSTENVSILRAMNTLAIKMIADSNYKTTYLNTICDYLDELDTTSKTYSEIDSLAAIIYPDFAAEPDSNQMFPEQAFYATIDTMTIHTPIGDIPALKKFMANRRAHVIAELDSIGWICSSTPVTPPGNFQFDFSVYPNPFGNSLTIHYEIPGDEQVSIELFDAIGKRVAVILSDDNFQSAGDHTFTTDLSTLDAGIYLIRFKSGEYSKVIKLIEVK
ncbi:MAG: CotH kinase family protein [Bacteroidetes bacterium]|nr:CotH kinase family protein [Bacteroidota bacterium]